MRADCWPPLFWLVIAGSWALGFLLARAGIYEPVLMEMGRAVSVPGPESLAWWQPIPYFLLTVLAAFVLSHLFFGAASALFSLCRGMNDYLLLQGAAAILSGFSQLEFSTAQLGQLFFITVVLVANLPLSLWAAHLGAENSMKALYRLRGRPWRDWGNRRPLPNLLLALGASIAAGVAASFALSYA
ncbi:MAG: hypothetical protein QW567_03455 [Candidatus Hadarchaeales archaeon]